jgi:predicted extracellular nuclease
MITTNDDWSAVPGIVGYRGDDLTTSTGTNPQTILSDGTTTPVDVNANKTDPNTFTTGGIAEFEIADPVVALQGSGTADAPFLLISINTTGLMSITVSYKLRDIDGSGDNAVQPVALHYRVGTSGDFTDVPAAFVADATTGPNLATLVTPVSVTLPSNADNQPVVQLRMMTTNAAGSDEWVGVDDILITGTPIVTDTPPTVTDTTPATAATGVAINANLIVNFSESVTVTGNWFDITCGTSGSHTAIVSGGPASYTLNPDADFAYGETCTATIYAAQVTDQDGTPDPMAADYVWSFSTAAPPASVTIYNIQYTTDPAGASPYAGQFVTTQGIVTAVMGKNVFIQDGAGAWNGLLVYDPVGAPLVGDQVAITGTVAEYFSLTEMATGAALTVLSSGNPLPATQVLDPDAVADEQWESLFVRVENVTVINANPDAPSDYGEWVVDDDGVGGIRVDDLGYRYRPALGTALTFVQGPLYYSFSNFKIEPRDSGDVGAPPASCSTIPLIQGTGNDSPCADSSVANVRGCITGVAAKGFYMQAVGGDVDGDPATSDGIYVYQGGSWTNPAGWAPGYLVSVSGQIIEYYNLTELQAGDAVTVLNGGTNCGGYGYPAAVTIGPNTDPNADPMTLYERYEGMRVQMTFGGWVVGPTKRYTSRFAFGDPEIAFVDFGSSIPDYDRVFERDYAGYQGINYITGGLNFDLPNLDFGDEISGTNVTGVLGYQFDKYTLLVDAAPALTTVDRPDVPSHETAVNPANGEFDICFANVENLFDNHNDGLGDWGDWAPGWPTPDTAEGTAAYQAKLSKVAGMLVDEAKSCLVIGLAEVEGKQQVYDDLAATMHISDSAHTWTAGFVASGDERNITQGFLWRNDVALIGSVVPVAGAPYTTWVGDGVLDFVRTPPTGLFRFNAGSANQVDIHLYAVHFKSKRASTSCTTADCTDVREKEAADLCDILLHHQNASERAVGGGDFNDTFGSSPIGILDGISPTIKSLYYDLGERERWSYIFNGESEVLDHLYATGNLLPMTAGWTHAFSPVHVNADFPEPEHASDHDPLRVRFAPYGLTITRGSGAAATLTWSAVSTAAAYQVWRDTSPYFTPSGNPLETLTGLEWTDPNATGDPLMNYFYLVTAINANGAAVGTSIRAGEFDFALVPGQQ